MERHLDERDLRLIGSREGRREVARGQHEAALQRQLRRRRLRCPSVPPEATPPLPKGTGANHWSAAGFTIKGKSKDFGTLTLSYWAASGNLSGSGVNPPCAQGLSWSIKVKIELASGQTAIGDISLTRE